MLCLTHKNCVVICLCIFLIIDFMCNLCIYVCNLAFNLVLLSLTDMLHVCDIIFKLVCILLIIRCLCSIL